MPLEVRNLQRRVRVSVPRIRALGARVLSALGRADREAHVTVVDDPSIRRLNAAYRRRRAATDVLAFNLESPGPSPLLGEVVISAETAARQARRLRVPVALELDLLVVHGLLHLAGYDDREPHEARLMHQRSREILTRGGHRPVPGRLWTGLLEG
jgi:probable rRNA maturation factor